MCKKEREERKERKRGLYKLRKSLKLYFGISNIYLAVKILRCFLATCSLFLDDTSDDTSDDTD